MPPGDAVNPAARLQPAAEPGRVVVGPAVFDATKETIDYRELEALDLKGKESATEVVSLRVQAHASPSA